MTLSIISLSQEEFAIVFFLAFVEAGVPVDFRKV